MRLRFGVGAHWGPFWAGVVLNPLRYVDHDRGRGTEFSWVAFLIGGLVSLLLIAVAVACFVAFLFLLL